MNNIKQEDEIRLIETEKEWKQFLEIIRENFPEYINKLRKVIENKE